MKITISGKPGAGKSTIGKLLAERLGYSFYAIGQMRRKIASDLGISIDELNDLGEVQSFTDEDVDNYVRNIGKNEDHFIVEGAVAFHFVPDSIKIFMDISSEEGANRIFKSDRWDEKTYTSEGDTEDTIASRMESNRKRYQKYYGIDYLDQSQYNIIINTNKKTEQEVLDEIEEAVQNYKEE